jgi:hypothetical protein
MCYCVALSSRKEESVREIEKKGEKGEGTKNANQSERTIGHELIDADGTCVLCGQPC